jgi:hypothetical protein
MQVRALAQRLHLVAVATPVITKPRMQRLMDVSIQVDHILQRQQAFLWWRI